VIDAVGVDASAPHGDGKGNFEPGGAPEQALTWAVDAVAKAGTVSLIGVYGENVEKFPIGKAFMKNVRIHTGNCHHRRYIPHLIELVRTGAIDPTRVLTQEEPLTDVIDAYRAFDRREPGWIKVELQPDG
jgi:threonine dehydrogenase-like Zn-dependent dehydrogenase